MSFTAFREMHPFSQLLFSAFVMLICFIAIFTIGLVAAVPFVGFDTLLEQMQGANMDNPSFLSLLKYIQVIQSIGLFVVPPFFLAYFFYGNVGDNLYLNRFTKLTNIVPLLLIVVLINPVINLIGELNSQMKFPEVLSGLENWMHNMEDNAEFLIKRFMNVKSTGGLLFNLFMIAVIPALGEEFLFRGIIQRIFSGWTRSIHWGIWISAFLFSAMHMQFFGFFPRMILGALFGYLLVWTGTIWVPVIGHFINNTIGVIGYYYINKGIIAPEAENFGSNPQQYPYVIGSIIIVILLMIMIYKNKTVEIRMPANHEDSQAN